MPSTKPVLYETAKVRSTGARTQVLDLRPEGKYALRCATHDHEVEADRRLPAEAASHRPQDWCPKCRAAAKRRAASENTSGATAKQAASA